MKLVGFSHNVSGIQPVFEWKFDCIWGFFKTLRSSYPAVQYHGMPVGIPVQIIPAISPTYKPLPHISVEISKTRKKSSRTQYCTALSGGYRVRTRSESRIMKNPQNSAYRGIDILRGVIRSNREFIDAIYFHR